MDDISKAASVMGSSRSPAKVAASRENGKKGGRPPLPKFTVTDPNRKAWPNLVGVFRREFPIAAKSGNVEHVTYHGVRYKITPRD